MVAPATTNFIAKAAAGLADNSLTTTILATRAPIMVAPAMDGHMFDNPATQDNLSKLRDRGISIVGPESGRLASGMAGMGRMVEPAMLVGHIRAILGREGDLSGYNIVVSAGGTQEPIDPVRIITNRSSGKMGYAIAEAARDREHVLSWSQALLALSLQWPSRSCKLPLRRRCGRLCWKP